MPARHRPPPRADAAAREAFARFVALLGRLHARPDDAALDAPEVKARASPPSVPLVGARRPAAPAGGAP